ncbi:putative secreted RxLR effector protein [Phytophthora cinnamomi]|uniref:putative secreted RxLR effector protein n=1 Tax=Phytophthora cinnamomi TaxID=4785 RepID=UPI00355A4EE6|nr:putative secreted RxLR effector protein [Phytophthora cinnamomi]
MVLIAIATLGATGVHADENPLPPNHLVTSEPVADEKTWMPFRALRSMDSPKQEPQYDGKHSHHELPAPPAAKAIPAPTKAGSSNARVTPAPTKTNTPKATPASTTTKTTPHPNTTMPKVASPPATKPPATKQGKTGVSSTSNAAQHNTRNLGGDEPKQLLPHHDDHHHHDAKQGAKNGEKHL